MRDGDEFTMTEAVIERFAGAPDPRLRVLVQGLVRHLHAFVRETEPTFDEWHAAIDYLTRTGQMCTATRQEFILLSDVLGITMLVDAINHRQPDGAT
jgi:hydroxyquinol 1,2-dioxygenase